ncbi:MAG: hypothetical protein WA991_13000 [Ornithinimicrobium sp.]
MGIGMGMGMGIGSVWASASASGRHGHRDTVSDLVDSAVVHGSFTDLDI